MLQDLIKIQPQAQKNYHPARYEFATPVKNPQAIAWQYFQWALISHARKKPAEAYKYYEKAIMHHKRPVYLRQMALLHHEMGYFREALDYLRLALDLEKREYLEKITQQQQLRRDRVDYSGDLPVHYTRSDSHHADFRYSQN